MLSMLYTAQSGLRTSQAQVDNVSNNLANENVVGYKKRIVQTAELEHLDGGVGRGIEIQDITSVSDIYMYQNLVREEGRLSSIEELDSMLEGIESIFYETDDSGISADLNRYFSSIENLRTSPSNEVYKNDLKNSANALVNNIQSLYSNIEQLEETTLSKVEQNVDEINSILVQIGDISQQILEADPEQTPVDLLDKRDQLEKELSKYIDVEISRGETYQLKIGGATAVRFDTNVHTLNLIENYQPQQDFYVKQNEDGSTKYPYESSIIDTDTWTSDPVAEVQDIDLSGEVDDGVSDDGDDTTVMFLGRAVPTQQGDSVDDFLDDIDADKDNIIDVWNKNHPDREIDSISIDKDNDKVSITYKDLEGDVAPIDNSSSNGIDFSGSVESTKGEVDSVTYVVNNDISITVTRGETVVDDAGNAVDLDGDGDNTNDQVTEDNVLQALMYKINESKDIDGLVRVYNGQYEIAEDGSKILTNDERHSDYDPDNPNKDRYLIIEAQVPGEKGRFVGEFFVNDRDVDGKTIKKHISQNSNLSNIGTDDIHIEIFDQTVPIEGGELKSQLDNIKTDSGNNLFKEYKDRLDQFVKRLSDITDSYIQNIDQSYIYGTDAVELEANSDNRVNIGLFSGASVKSLKFNENAVDNLDQEKLDYLATIQWKDDIDFDGTGNNKQSFSAFYRTLRAGVADDRENVLYKKESQSAVTESINNAYDKLTKVDKDAEMIELIKFQSAYQASAKIITVVDEMLKTLLNMR